MRKNIFIFMLVAFLIVAGCSQNTSKQNGQNGQASGESQGAKSDFPNKVITLVVPFDVGSGTDVAARIVSDIASKYIPNNVRFAVENKGGGAGTIGLGYLANAKPDGYTIGLSPKAPLVIQPLVGSTTYTADDFEPIMKAFSSFQAMIVAADAPWQTVEEWSDYVKNNPGKFSYGHTGIGSAGHLAMAAVQQQGLNIKEVPFQGGGPAMSSLLGGHVDGIVAVPTNIDESLTRVLFNVSSNRSEFFPDAATLMESGFNISNDTYYGLLAPKGTPQEVIAVIHDAFKQAMEDPETNEKLKGAGLEVTYESAEQFKQQIQNDAQNDKAILDSLGLSK